MQTIIRFIVNLLVLATLVHADPVVRFPLVTEQFYTEIHNAHLEADAQKYPGHYNPSEGLWSSAYSSAQGEFDYFVIKNSSPSGGRILKMSPILTTFQGVVSSPVFTDVITGETSVMDLQTQDNRDGVNDGNLSQDGLVDNYFHYGSFRIGSDLVYIMVGYMGTLRYPMIMLTWGEGANVGDPGTIIDTFEMVYTSPKATVTELGMLEIKGEEGFLDGVYLLVNSPKEFGEVEIETSSDFKRWSRIDLAPFAIYGETILYSVPQEKLGFFRGIER